MFVFFTRYSVCIIYGFAIYIFTIECKNIYGALNNIKAPSLSWIRKSLKKLKISRRRFKISKIVSSCRERYSIQLQTFIKQISSLKNEEIVCIDETGFCNVGNTIYRYFPAGKIPKSISVTRRESRSLIMAIHPINGIINHTLQKKPFNSISFLDYIKTLIPELPIGTKALLMDNVSFHKTRAVQALLSENNITPLFIPPYTPQCNPIEEVFSVLKNIFRSLELDIPFEDRILGSLNKLKLYKGVVNNYNHTREFINNECHLL